MHATVLRPFLADPAVETALDGWIDRDDPLLVRLEYGPGGVGKTRRWLEYCHVREGLGLYGLLSRCDDPVLTADHFGQVAAASETRVLVIDYAESQPELVKRLLARALDGSAGRTRIILLARNASEWWARLRRSSASLQALLSSPAVTEARAIPMAIPQDRHKEAMAGAVSAYSAHFGIAGDVPVPKPAQYGSALEIQMAALASVTAGGMDDLVAAIVDRERRFWEKCATPALPATLLEAMAAAIYQVGGVASLKEAERMFAGRGAFRDLRAHELVDLFALMRSLYPGERFLNPVQPDLIGERLLEEHGIC